MEIMMNFSPKKNLFKLFQKQDIVFNLKRYINENKRQKILFLNILILKKQIKSILKKQLKQF